MRSLPTIQSVIDPVCGMTVDPSSAAGYFEHEGRTYYFCSQHCLHKFREDPERFLHGGAAPMDHHEMAAPAPAAGEKIEYTCPMHPEIIRDAPGSARSAAWRSNRAP